MIDNALLYEQLGFDGFSVGERHHPPRVWHGSAIHEGSVELAAEFGDPVFSANVSNPVDRYAELIRHYYPPAAPLSAFIEGRPYHLDAALFDPADAARLDVIAANLLARRC